MTFHFHAGDAAGWAGAAGSFTAVGAALWIAHTGARDARAQATAAAERAAGLRDAERRARRLAVIRAALDEVGQSRIVIGDPRMGDFFAPMSTEAITNATREIGPRPEEVAHQLAMFRDAAARYATVSSLFNAYMTSGSHPMLRGGYEAAAGEELRHVDGALQATEDALSGMLAALDAPQASGLRWYD